MLVRALSGNGGGGTDSKVFYEASASGLKTYDVGFVPNEIYVSGYYNNSTKFFACYREDLVSGKQYQMWNVSSSSAGTPYINNQSTSETAGASINGNQTTINFNVSGCTDVVVTFIKKLS